MKKMLVLVVTALVLLMLSACQSDVKDLPTFTSFDTSVADAIQNYPIYIDTVVDVSDEESKCKIEYPQLGGQSEEYATINALLHSEMDMWLKGEVDADAAIDVSCSVTYCDKTYFCVLFEGRVVGLNAAHPTNVVRSVCVSLVDEVIIDPLAIIEIDEAFVNDFKNQLNNARDTKRFTDEQWQSVVAYFHTFSNQELMQKIVNGEIALTEDGVLVCIEVPHAIGDYIKVAVNS